MEDQTTVMYMKCKHEMINWSKWFVQNPQTSHHINCCKHECTTATQTQIHTWLFTQNEHHKTQIYKLQVSGFTFPKPTKLSTTSRKLMPTSLCRNSAISFQSRIVSNHLLRSNWIQKNIHWSYPTRYRSQSYLTGYRSELYMNCTALSLMRYRTRPCPSSSSCFKGPYQRYSLGFIFSRIPPSTFWR